MRLVVVVFGAIIAPCVNRICLRSPTWNYSTTSAIAIAVPAREGEPLAELVERESHIRQLQRQLKQLENKLASEKQFNRKVDLNTEVRRLTAELNAMMSP